MNILKEIENEKIIKIILNEKKKESDSEHKKIIVLPFEKKGELFYQFEIYFENKVTHLNISTGDFIDKLTDYILNTFNQAMVYTEKYDCHITSYNKKIKHKISNPSGKSKTLSHNNIKNYILNENENIDFLVYLGIMNKNFKVNKSMYNKFKQINKYLELLTPVIKGIQHKEELKIVDFGCGKSYLTFALYYYLVNIMKLNVTITGLDLKDDVIEFCQNTANVLKYDKLFFKKGDIADYDGTSNVDLVIMLHACDIATDEGIVQSLKFNAKAIVAVPCCQHELFSQIKNNTLSPILEYGILKEKISSIITDTVRSQLLKSLGFNVNVIEFIETEHTPKNIAIKAIKKSGFDEKEFLKYLKMKTDFNIDPYIEKRLICEGLIPNPKKNSK